MATRKKSTPKTFKAAYAILKTNAESLQDNHEPDIDNLMTTVEQSIAAYKVCQSRIDAVQQALDAAFDEDIETDIEKDSVDKDNVDRNNMDENNVEKDNAERDNVENHHIDK